MRLICSILLFSIVTVGSLFFASACSSGHQAAGAPPLIRRHNPPTLHELTGESNVVEVTGGRTVYVAGQPPLDKSGAVMGRGDFVAQSKQSFENVKAALAAVNANFSNVVKMNFYLTDMSQIRALRAVREEYLDNTNLPVMTIVQVPHLRREEFAIEIDAIAVVPD